MGGAPGGHPRQPGEPERSDRTVQLPRSAAEGFQRQHHAHGVGRADKTRRCGSGRAVAWWWARRLAISALSLLAPPGHPRASRHWIPCPPRLSRGGAPPGMQHAAMQRCGAPTKPGPAISRSPAGSLARLGLALLRSRCRFGALAPQGCPAEATLQAVDCQWATASGLPVDWGGGQREAASDHLQFRIRMYLPQPYWTRCTEKEAATGLSRAQILLLSSFGQLRHVPN